MIGLIGAAAVLLLVAGLAKIIRPAPTVAALSRSRLPGRQWWGRSAAIRVFGAAEIVIGSAVLVVGGRWSSLALAAGYLLLTIVAVQLLRLSPGTDCGCFGRAQGPISRGHVIVNSAFTLAAVLCVRFPQTSMAEALSGTEAVLLVVLTLLLAWLAYLTMTALPELTALRRNVEVER